MFFASLSFSLHSMISMKFCMYVNLINFEIIQFNDILRKFIVNQHNLKSVGLTDVSNSKLKNQTYKNVTQLEFIYNLIWEITNKCFGWLLLQTTLFKVVI
jgi:hypothetical protein